MKVEHLKHHPVISQAIMTIFFQKTGHFRQNIPVLKKEIGNMAKIRPQKKIKSLSPPGN
jgi:hypothetical protein